MSKHHHIATRNAFIGVLTLAVAVGTGLLVPPPAYAAVCHSVVVTIDFSGASGPSSIPGTDGRDVILGGPFDDTIYGGGGDDIICGGRGTDTILGGNGNDVIHGDGTNSGADANNNLYGENANDTIRGDQNNDVISGGRGDDNLYGGVGGDDTIVANDDGPLSRDHVDGEENDAGAGDTCYFNGSDVMVNCEN